jgi:hypothetical protein
MINLKPTVEVVLEASNSFHTQKILGTVTGFVAFKTERKRKGVLPSSWPDQLTVWF